MASDAPRARTVPVVRGDIAAIIAAVACVPGPAGTTSGPTKNVTGRFLDPMIRMSLDSRNCGKHRLFDKLYALIGRS